MKYFIEYRDNEPLCIHLNNSVIPMDESNTDYKAYLAWVAEGNVAEEWNPNGN
jgi:hypothetical protein